MGGRFPDKTIESVKIFIDKNNSNKDFIINLFGKEKEIQNKIHKYKIDTTFINIINSDTVVSDEETPLTAVKNSKILVCGIV